MKAGLIFSKKPNLLRQNCSDKEEAVDNIQLRGLLLDVVDALKGCKRIEAAINRLLPVELAEDILEVYEKSPDGLTPAKLDDVLRWVQEEIKTLSRE